MPASAISLPSRSRWPVEPGLELGRRAGDQVGAGRVEPFLHLGILDRLGHHGLHAIDQGRRRAGGGEEAVPVVEVEARIAALGEGRHVGEAAERLRLVTASTRADRPPRGGRIELVVMITESTAPAPMSRAASAPPR